jgi:CRP/FNR family nitrogen fixation transcriptional regulator
MPVRTLSIASPSGQAQSARPRHEGGELTVLGIARTFARDQMIYREGDRADFIFKVVSGAVRISRLLCDGRRQIQAFYLPGDVFGIELRPQRLTRAEAIADCVIAAAPRSSFMTDPAQETRLFGHAVDELQRTQEHVLTLGRRTAMERLASFVIDLAQRMGDAPDVCLPMSRQDIADYLGLTIETVSRTLTQMQARRLVRLRGRQLHLLAQGELANICE